MTSSDYEYEYAGKTVQLGVHCSGVAREPRVRWQIDEQSGKHGYIRLDAPKSVVHLEEGETVRLDNQLVSEIPAPGDIAEELKAAVENLGTVVPESNRITSDPAAFLTEIAGFEQVGWEAARSVMWYWRDERSSPRAYQIERGSLVFRAQEWPGDDVASKTALSDRYDLATIF